MSDYESIIGPPFTHRNSHQLIMNIKQIDKPTGFYPDSEFLL